MIAFAACFIESLLPIHLIGAAVIAMFLGMLLNHFLGRYKILSTGLKFTSKKILKFAIILLGLSLNITTILNVGKMSLLVMVFTLATCFGRGYFIGKALRLNWKLSNLISAGTGICGGSAIAAMVKLTRTLAIIPTVIVFALIQLRIKKKECVAVEGSEEAVKTKFNVLKIFPWFILGFLGMSILASIFSIPAVVVSSTKSVSKFLMVCALAAIGLNTPFSSMKKSGLRPMIHGFIISLLVVIVALAVEIFMGLV